MSTKHVITILEITVGRCSRTYGSAPCAAVLGTTGQHKCFNTKTTCQDRANYANEETTLRLTTEVSVLPLDGNLYYPCVTSVSENPTSVNIGGNDPKLSAFGRLATLKFNCKDFPANDNDFDRYYLQRISGAAQADAQPRDPNSAASFFKYLKARWPTYIGARCRVRHGIVVDGVFTEKAARTYALSEVKGPDLNGRLTFEAKDALSFIEDKNALAPKISQGRFIADIDEVATVATLFPEGVGDLEYPVAGFVAANKEIMAFTRVGDVLTLTRGQHSTTPVTHSQDDSVQLCLVFSAARVDTVLNTLLTEYTDLPASWAPLATWEAEVTRWISGLLLDRVIAKPTAVSTLIKELAIVGVSIWSNPTDEEISLKVVRPPFGDPVVELTDDSIIRATQEDRDDARITAVHMHSALLNPLESTTDAKSYGIHYLATDQQSAEDYDFQSIREIYCPWLGVGSFDTVRVTALRILRAYRRAPIHVEVTISAEQFALALTDVVDISTTAIPNEVGDVVPIRTQVARIYEPIAGHEVEALLQAFRFDGRYSQIMPDSTTGTYLTATDDEKETGGYISSDTDPAFPDNSNPYEVI